MSPAVMFHVTYNSNDIYAVVMFVCGVFFTSPMM